LCYGIRSSILVLRIPPPRIAPLNPPYDPETEAALAKWMPPGSAVEPLKLFRVLAHNRAISERMHTLGAGILGRSSSIEARDRELVILRTCARLGCEYEWGVHASAFGEIAGLDSAALRGTAASETGAYAWSDREQLLLSMVDELHNTGQLSNALWEGLEKYWTAPQTIELIVIAGFYHLISFVANAARVPLEPWAARFPA
jgi:4-carboxymuconolactone decarboxylase